MVKRKSILPSHDRDPVAVAAAGSNWGLLPLLSLTSACGLLIIAFADTGARNELPSASALFWIGLLVLFVPIAVRLLSQGASRRERITLLCIVGLGLYLVKVLHSPTAFSFHDEFLHWRTAIDISNTRYLFNRQSLLPVSPLFPGLEIVTAAVQSLSGLSIFDAGIVVIGTARLVIVLSLYLLYEKTSSSAWIAGIATLLYMTNPHFLFFDAMFSYESLALPLATFVIFATIKRSAEGTHIGLNLMIVLALAAVVVTHHLTSYVLTTFLVLWTIWPVFIRWVREFFFWYAGEKTTLKLTLDIRQQLPSLWERLASTINARGTPTPWWIAILSLMASLAWLVFIAGLVITYLSPLLTGALHELFGLISAETTTRQLFQDYSGETIPNWERLSSIVSVFLTLAFIAVGAGHMLIPLGARRIWRRYHSHARGVLFAVIVVAAFAYPLGLALRLTTFGADVSIRATPFLYVAIAFVVSVGFAAFYQRQTSGWRALLVIAVVITISFIGGIVEGAGPIWARLPGPYLVSADARSIELNGISAAEWTKSYLGANNRIATDRINRLLTGTYGEQDPVTNLGDHIDVSPLFFSLEWDAIDQEILQRGRIRYLIVDHRLSTGLPRVGIYFEEGESGGLRYTNPLNPAVLAKFDHVDNISRIFDSGALVIYYVGELALEPPHS